MRDLRVDQALDLRHLQQATGINRATLSQIERGRLSPTAHEITQISRALGVDLHVRMQLVYEENA
jgi:transcriptional regulator with XRE-family HTH domain